MQVKLHESLCTKVNKAVKPDNKKIKDNIVKKTADSNCLSFMSIPGIAFMGKMVVPALPEELKMPLKPHINFSKPSSMVEETDKPSVKFIVYPQDPLVTDAETTTLKGEVAPGPESSRVRTVDTGEAAMPDAEGNYIAGVDTPQFDRINAYHFVQKTLQNYQEALGREIPWSFYRDQILIYPRAGEKMNASYNRADKSIKLYYFKNKFKDETCYTSKMADVITHETGHAILDGLRPGYIGWGSNNRALHEGFADSTALLIALSRDSVINNVIKKTGGDLRKENIIASLGEQFAMAVYGDRMYLRNSINDLRMSDYSMGRESAEPHNFGRLFGAVFYEIICEVAYKNAKNMPLKDALIKTGKDLTKILIRAAGDFSPPGDILYGDLAKALLKAEEMDFKGEYKSVIKKVLLDRQILSPLAIEKWEAEQEKLPSLRISAEAMKSKETILEFINKNRERLNLPAKNDYEIESAYRNKYGEIFLQLKAPKEVIITDSDPDDPMGGEEYKIVIYEGLTLGFDKSGKLFYRVDNKTEPFEMDNAIAEAKALLAKQKAIFNNGNKEKPVIYRESEGSNKLVKIPVFEDPVTV